MSDKVTEVDFTIALDHYEEAIRWDERAKRKLQETRWKLNELARLATQQSNEGSGRG